MPNLPINEGAWREPEFAIGMGPAPEHNAKEPDVEQLKDQYKKAVEKMAYFQSIATAAESARVQSADELSKLQDQIYRSSVGFDDEKIKSYDRDEALKAEYSEGREAGLKAFEDRKSEIDRILDY